MSFSTGLKITNLDDFITPTTACVLPVAGMAVPEGSVAAPIYGTSAESSAPARVARVTLSDCLSCSGCLTSAETVLLDSQSVDAFRKQCAEAAASGRIVVASVAPAALASLATHWGLQTQRDALRELRTRLRPFGVRAVVGNGIGRALSVLQTCREVVQRLESTASRAAPHPQVLMASACPGWTCYVEKTQPELVPYLSRAKSPQAMMGAWLERRYGDAVWHCSIMPCYDKKLESMRADLHSETDCVLATTEVLELLAEGDASPLEDPVPVNDVDAAPEEEEEAWTTTGGLSGGYALQVFRYVCRQRYHLPVPDEQLVLQPVRPKNADLRQLLLYRDTTTGALSVGATLPQAPASSRRYEVVYAVATAYGFRNIQNIVRRFKQAHAEAGARPPWDFIEVMACPSGCGNGGGQYRPEHATRNGSSDGGATVPSARAWKAQLQAVERVYAAMPSVHPEQCETAMQWWRRLEEEPPSALCCAYRAVTGATPAASGSAAPATATEW